MCQSEFILESYEDGNIMFKPLESYDCISVYDNDLSGDYYVDINLQSLVIAGKYRKFESRFCSGCNLWYSAIEKNTISFKCDVFEILKEKDEDEVKKIVFEKWKSILHMAMKDDNNTLKLIQKGIVLQKEVNKVLLDGLEKMNIYKMPYYYADRLNAPYIKKGQIKIEKIKKDLDWYYNNILE